MFYFSAEERDEITRKKKRRRLEEGRNDRMRALEAEEEASRPAVETEVNDNFSQAIGICKPRADFAHFNRFLVCSRQRLS